MLKKTSECRAVGMHHNQGHRERGAGMLTFDLAHLTHHETVHWGLREVREGRYSRLNGHSSFGPKSPDVTPLIPKPTECEFQEGKNSAAFEHELEHPRRSKKMH